jgi:2-oxoisovalerate ferredoxin oxidoreductase beta subunit
MKVRQQKARCFYPQYFRKTTGSQDQTHYCPGCGHGLLHKLIAEAIDDLGLQQRTVLVSPVGCSVFAYYYFDVGNVQAAHGRAAAVACAMKRALPESIVISYQGDGDLAAIGTAETIHTANRGEPITVFFVNNAIYGMTGGQMAPTTLIGQKTTTSPFGRGRLEGEPLRMCELLSQLATPAFIERVAVDGSKNIMRARKAVRKALEYQAQDKGFSFVEVLSACPTGWKMEPEEAAAWVREVMIPAFPLGNYRDRPNPVGKPAARPSAAEVPDLIDVPRVVLGEGGEGAGAVRKTEWSINIAGFGGQGVMYLGKLLAEAGMRAGLRTSFIPSYGPEMRGGTAHCYVQVSRREIGSPISQHPTLLVAMNEPSLARFHSSVVDGGVIIYNGPAEHFQAMGVTDRVRSHAVPANEIADALGNARLANMVVLGVIVAAADFLSAEIIEKTMAATVAKAAVVERNLKAFRAGIGALTTA